MSKYTLEDATKDIEAEKKFAIRFRGQDKVGKLHIKSYIAGLDYALTILKKVGEDK